MTWEEFLIVTAYRCQLKGTAQKFFIELFTDEIHIELSREDLAQRFCIELKTCKTYLTEIFKTVGQGNFQRPNQRLRELNARLKAEYQKCELAQQSQVEARSRIPCTIDEQLHLAIRHLNYNNQKIAFVNALAADQAAQALLVRVDNLGLQKWLVWRLVQKFHEIDGIEAEKPFRLTVRATRHWGAQPEEIWRWLARGVHCDDASPNRVLDEIAATCQTRSVVIAIYEISQIKPVVWEYFLREFWQPLTDRLNAHPCGIQQRRCLLFLTGHAEYHCHHSISVLTELSTWKIVQEEDWKLWLRNRQVQEFLNQATTEQDWLSMRLEKPEVVIRGLGQEVGLSDGIEEMVRHWNLEPA